MLTFANGRLAGPFTLSGALSLRRSNEPESRCTRKLDTMWVLEKFTRSEAIERNARIETSTRFNKIYSIYSTNLTYLCTSILDQTIERFCSDSSDILRWPFPWMKTDDSLECRSNKPKKKCLS